MSPCPSVLCSRLVNFQNRSWINVRSVDYAPTSEKTLFNLTAMFRTYTKVPPRLAPTLPRTMLYSQALTGHKAPAGPSSSPSASATSTTQSDTPTAQTPGLTKQIHTKTTTSHHPSTSSPTRRQPNPDHKPNTTSPEQTVYVLTLTTTPSLTDPLTALRRSHFPRHLDRHPAHLTLFHALPGSEMPLITAVLDELCAAQRPVRLATGGAFRMRRGVGINVADAGNGGGQGGGGGGGGGGGPQAARRLHGELQRRWWEVLSAQDRRPWRPHWTVQNKAADERAVDAAMEHVRMGFRGAEGLATGCALWRYEKGGGWAFERGFDFEGDKPVSR